MSRAARPPAGSGPLAARGRRGFTLIELTVALLAGLIVALGIMGLSRDATHTFHEEMRSSAAEATLRTAVDRLRADLQRAGFMSTGNVILDPMIATAPGQSNLANVVGGPTTYPGLARLASIYLQPGGSVTSNFLTLSTYGTNAVNPDMIDIGGNMTSSDQYDVQLIQQTPTGNCTYIYLSPTSPAMYRILAANGDAGSSTNAAQLLHDVFQPVPDTDSTQFVVRLVDDTGHSQYLLTCPVPFAGTDGAAGFSGGTQPYVQIDTAETAIVTSSMAQTNGGVSGFAAGVAWVNPVQVARWEITSAAGTPNDLEPSADQALAGQPLAPTTPDPAKYDLMRSYVDPTTGLIIPDTSEIVAEYAVDLDFAFTVDNSTNDLAPNVVTYGFEDPSHNDPWGASVSVAGTAATQGPQRIRAVRARVSTRTAQPDRTVNIAVSNYGSQNFMYRYQLDATDWARVRTIVTQVSLPNQARNFY